MPLQIQSTHAPTPPGLVLATAPPPLPGVRDNLQDTLGTCLCVKAFATRLVVQNRSKDEYYPLRAFSRMQGQQGRPSLLSQTLMLCLPRLAAST